MHYPPHPVHLPAPQPAPSDHAVPAAPRRTRRFPWGRLLLVLALVGLAVLSTVVLSFRMGGGARTARAVLLENAGTSYASQIEFGVGRIPAFAARSLVRFLPVDPEVKTALAAFRHADIGVYRRDPSEPFVPGTSDAETFAALRSQMARQGWIPAVTVREPDELVMIFVHERSLSDAHLSACVVVRNREEMVVVSGGIDPRPLADLIESPRLPHLPVLLSSR